MKIYSEIMPAAIESGSFEDEAGQKIEYFKVQFMDTVSKRLGEEYVDVEDVASCGISKELLAKIEVGKKTRVELRVGVTNPKSGFPKPKFTIVSVG